MVRLLPGSEVTSLAVRPRHPLALGIGDAGFGREGYMMRELASRLELVYAQQNGHLAILGRQGQGLELNGTDINPVLECRGAVRQQFEDIQLELLRSQVEIRETSRDS